MAQGETINLRSWRAGTWDELIEILDDLVPDLMEHEEYPRPQFRGAEITPQQAGFVFENWVLEAFRLSGAEVEAPYTIPGRSGTREEHDGVVVDGWRGFLVESNLHKKGIKFSPIALLNFHVETRPSGTLGLLFSPRGYTRPALELAEMFRPLRVLLVDAPEFISLRNSKNVVELVREKWKLAVKWGRPTVAVM